MQGDCLSELNSCECSVWLLTRAVFVPVSKFKYGLWGYYTLTGCCQAEYLELCCIIVLSWFVWGVLGYCNISFGVQYNESLCVYMHDLMENTLTTCKVM